MLPYEQYKHQNVHLQKPPHLTKFKHIKQQPHTYKREEKNRNGVGKLMLTSVVIGRVGNAKKFLADFSRPKIKEGLAKIC